MNIILKAYSIKDSKTQSFAPPFFNSTHGEAERTFVRITKNPQSVISEFPDDYDLFYVGEFDTATGKLTELQTPQHVVKASLAKKVDVGPIASQTEMHNSASMQ